MCETGTKTVLICFSQLESELLHKSKEPPDTGFYRAEWTSSHQCTSWPFCPLDGVHFFIWRQMGFITVPPFFFWFLTVFPLDLTCHPARFPTLLSTAPTLVPYLLSPSDIATRITSYAIDLATVLTTYLPNLATLLITYLTNLPIYLTTYLSMLFS